MKLILLFALMALGSYSANAQHAVKFKVVDADSSTPIPGVNILVVGTTIGAVSNELGEAEIPNLEAGTYQFRISIIGYEVTVLQRRVPDDTGAVILVEMEHHHEELEDVTIYAARGSRLIDRVPTRAEVIAGEELEEKANMNSSNISMILRETPGLQVQMTDPSTANMSFRIQGLNGRYTQLLQDGLPMYGGISSSLSIVQIPPLNLKQVEIIKGSSSTLYGGGAIAGLVNLVTKTYEDEGTMVMLNGLSTVGGDLNVFSAGKVGEIGYTAYVSGVAQKAYDVNNDGFAEVPKTNRIHAEPTLWIPIGSSATLRTGIGFTRDKRQGGFQNETVLTIFPTSNYFKTNIETDRFKAIADLEIDTKSNGSIQFRNVLSTTNVTSNDNLNHLLLNDQTQFFTELNTSFGSDASDFIAGVSHAYSNTSSTYRSQRIIDGQISNTTGLFAQYSVSPIQPVTVESGLRLEVVTKNDAILLPRLNVLTKWGPNLSSRFGVGTGYKHVHAMFSEVSDLIQQSNHMWSYNLRYDSANPIERSVGFTADLDYRTIIAEELGFSVNQLFFYTRINDPFQLYNIDSRYFGLKSNENNDLEPLTPTIALVVSNRNGHTQTKGMETNVKWSYRNFKWYQFYTYTDVSEVVFGRNLPVLLTPKHRFGSVIMLEEHDSYRVGFETYITGSQRLSSNRDDDTDPYVILGLMMEKTWNNLSLFINFENFTDTRMKSSDKLWSGSTSHPNLNTNLYAPIDGIVINGGVKIRF
jgi:iron complex outermembrane receptor protein